MNKDLKNNIGICPVINPVAYTATATSDLADLQGYESAMVEFSVGAGTFSGSNYITLTLEEADVTTGSSFTTVAAADLVGSFAVINGTAADEDSVQKVGYIGKSRYIRVVATETGTVSTVIGCNILLGNARENPAADVAITAAT